MKYEEAVRKFVEEVNKIAMTKPAYKQPGNGNGGVCSNVGLVIGAAERMGIKWDGIHGSNFAARCQTAGLTEITDIDDLEVGDLVYKVYMEDDENWNLPKRYWSGNKYFNKDMNDYYQVGVVTKVEPVVSITCMLKNGITFDLEADKWDYKGKLMLLFNPDDELTDEVPATAVRATVVSKNGLPVKMREYPSKSCDTYVKLAVGTEVTIVEPGEEWAKIDYGSRKGWYMMAQFLDVQNWR